MLDLMVSNDQPTCPHIWARLMQSKAKVIFRGIDWQPRENIVEAAREEYANHRI
jgi:hypothetical protein